MRSKLTLGLSIFLLLNLATLPVIQAQEEESDEPTQVSEDVTEDPVVSDTPEAEAAASSEPMEEMIVTGSRLKRTTFESISPLQIINADISREAGLVDAAEIVQTATSSADTQIDLTFSGYVLDNGPGASTANLRGLSSDRTLILLNGRRMAPGGVEGAPSNPDLNLIPASLVSQYDFLLDGASSLYGSDAIAGVVNVKLRRDFDGFEFRGSSDNASFGRSSSEMSITWGHNFSRGLLGAAYSARRDPLIRYSDSPFTQTCGTHYEIDENGEIRTDDVYYITNFGVDASGCRPGGITNIIYGLPQGIGTLYYKGDEASQGWPGFEESHQFLGGQLLWFDRDGDGLNDVDFKPHWANGKQQYRSLYNEFNQDSVMTYGEYTFEGDMNVTPFFETLYVKRQVYSETAIPQLFPVVHPLYPFNPCNPFGEGVDCGLARDAFFNDPVVVETIQGIFGCTVNTGGTCDLTTGPIGPVPVGIVVRVDGDRHQNDVNLSQMRWVAGVNMDLPFLDNGGFNNWSAELAFTYTSSSGDSTFQGIREDRLELATGGYSVFGIPCSADALPPGFLSPDVTAGCIPVNLFAPSLWDSSMRGEFATPEEREYLFSKREFDTRVSQKILSGFASGSVFSMPAGSVVGGIGFEHRLDTIDSFPNDVAGQGLLFGFFADQGAEGHKTTKEIFVELEFPLLGNMFLAEQLTFNISGRNTSDEYYGSHPTYSAKLGYRPITSLLLRATHGTSYRSPNLRNSFLLQQTGFLSLFDPCVTPDEAFDEVSGAYIASNDRREPIVLKNCALNGVDPTSYANGGFNSYSVEIASGGALDLEPETSESTSVGFAFEQPFTTAFDLTLGGSYYIIDVDNTIIEPFAGFIIYDCYNSPTSASPFCSRITREDDPSDPDMVLIDSGFINRDNDTVRGIDINLNFQDTITLFDRPFEFNLDWVSHKLLERSTLFINPQGLDDDQEFQNEWGFAEWRHTATLSVDVADFRFTYRPRYIGPMYEDIETVDPFDDGVFGFSDTCYGPPNDVLCKDIEYADAYLNHTVGLSYDKYNWEISAAILNVTDEPPPKVDATAPVVVRNNIPLGMGYDLLGRTFFVSAGFRFGGQ